MSVTVPSTLNIKWTDKLAFEVALHYEGSQEPLPDIIKDNRLTPAVFKLISQDPSFTARVDDYRSEIRAKGLTFKLKARAQAEDLLSTSYTIIHAQETPANVKADLIKATVKWAGLELTAGETTAGTNSAVTIVINMPGATDGQETRTTAISNVSLIEGSGVQEAATAVQEEVPSSAEARSRGFA